MPNRFDVFLSHATADKPLVEDLARRLRREGVEPWLDLWHLVPGEPWQPALARGLAESGSCAAIVGPGGFGSWQEEEIQAAINRRVSDRSRPFRVIPVLLPGVEKPERAKLPEFLTATMWVEFRGSIDEDEPFRRLVCGIRGQEPDVDPAAAPFAGECPYRGLEFFDFNDRDPRFFCGRETQVDDLLTMLRDTLPTDPGGGALRFLAVLGASGSGKSSLARAGLLPALRAGRIEGSGRWPIAIARPGREPLTGLATALDGLDGAAALGTYDRVAGQADGERSLHVTARRILGEPPRAGRLVVLVDQFEEVFTLCENEDERRALIANLLHAAKAPDGPAAVVLTMRADFLPRCAPYSALAAAVTGRQYLVEPMRRDDLRRAIERPAQLAGLAPETGLADLLLDDAEKNPGSLPLLQFVLKELWARRRGPRLTIEAYRDLGGMERAVARRADAVLAGLEKQGRGEIAKRVFLSLVKLGEGTEDTRRRARIAELVPAGGDEAAVDEVLRALTDPEARLVTASRDGTVEVAHEALIRSWPTLRKWVDADREGERIKQRLDEAAAEWDKNGRADGYLERRPRLALARKWADDHPGTLSPIAVDFLAASLARERAEKEDRENDARQRAELAEARERAETARADQALRFAEQQAQTTSRLWKLTALVVSLMVTALVIAFVAYDQRDRAKVAQKEAERQTKIATSRGLAALSASERDKRLVLSLLLAVEALRTENTFEALDSLHQALKDRPRLNSFLHTSDGPVSDLAVSPDGKTLAAGYNIVRSGGNVGGVVLWDAASRRRLAEEPLPVKEGGVSSVAFSPDGKALAAAYYGGGSGVIRDTGVVLWEVATRRRLAEEPLPVKEGSVSSVAFSPDGKVLAAGFGGGGLGGNGVVLWEVATRRRLAEEPLPVKEDIVLSVAFSPDGTTLAAGYLGRGGVGGNAGVVLWEVATRRRLAEEPLPVKEGAVSSVAFSPDGKVLAAGYYGDDGIYGGVVLWEVATRRRQSEEPLPVKEGGVSGVAFSPDSKTLAAGFAVGHRGVGGVVLWEVATRRRQSEEPLPVKEGGVSGVAFSPDGKTLAAGFAVGYGSGGYGVVDSSGVMLWDVGTRRRLAEEPLAVAEGFVSSVAFSPDGRTLAAGYFVVDGGSGVVLWDVAGRRRLAEEPLAVAEGSVLSVAFSPDGRTLAIGYRGPARTNGVVLWDVAGRRRLAEEPLVIKEGSVRDVIFSPDGMTLAAGYDVGVDSSGVMLWEVAGRRRLTENPLPVREGVELSVAFSPDGKTLAAGYRGHARPNGVVLWDVAGRRRLTENPLPVREDNVRSMAFSPDGKTLAGGCGHGVVLWDVAGRRRLTEESLAVAEGYVSDLAYSPDGTTLAAGYLEVGGDIGGGVVLWDVAGRRRLAEEPLPVINSRVQNIAFSLDGKTRAAAYSGCVVLWDVDFKSLQRRAARIANRNFTRDEWRQYFPDKRYRPTFPELPVPPEVSLQVLGKAPMDRPGPGDASAK